MDSPHLDPEAENQLRKYREEQRRRHEQLSHEGTTQQQPHQPSPQPYHPSPSFSSYPTPSAPLMSPENRRSLYPSLSNNTENDLKKSQEEEDERLARMLQQEEEEESAAPTSPQVRPTARNYTAPSPTITETPADIDEDEQLALALQESEQYQPDEPAQEQPAPAADSGGFLSTIGNIGRGLYNAYTTVSKAHQDAQRHAEQQAEQQVRQHNIETQHRQQIDTDAALARRIQEEEGPVSENISDADLARRMQEEEEANAQYEERQQQYEARQQQMRAMHQRQQPVQFVYRHPNFGYNNDMDDDNDNQMSPNPLITLSSVFRSTGAEPDEPLLRHLQELMRETRQPPMYRAPLPRHRYVFPRSAFAARGVEDLPPSLIHMMQGETDTSYEGLLDLAERMQPVSRGASVGQIDQLPSRTFSAGSMPSEHCKCGICLADYEVGEELTSLPCLHSFHKECISHWLGINKICPVCRVEIAGAQQ